MIVKDEEVSLPQVLKSVKGVVDEMVVLDTGSSDRTVEIAINLGASPKAQFVLKWCRSAGFIGVVWLEIGKVPSSLSALRNAIALHETHNPTEAQRLHQGLQEMGFQL